MGLLKDLIKIKAIGKEVRKSIRESQGIPVRKIMKVKKEKKYYIDNSGDIWED